jgi:serine/threonine-protein kinase PknK
LAHFEDLPRNPIPIARTTDATLLRLPRRYAAVEPIGRGGAGEVWIVEDRYTHRRLALKLLGRGASPAERTSLIQEAVALSGLEGLGVPRVLRFGRLEGSGRLYLLRELVEGVSLQELVYSGCEPQLALGALALAAEQLTRLHRAELLHGDVKPANIIVNPSGQATLVDLGLAAPLRESGTVASGLTPKYAAPELLQGRQLTVRAEIFALGVTLSEILENLQGALEPTINTFLHTIRERATMLEPLKRYPSADEFAAALRSAAHLPPAPSERQRAGLWPIVGFDNTSRRLMRAATDLAAGQLLHLDGPSGSGRSVLLRRLAWSLGVEDHAIVWVDDTLGGDQTKIALELSELERTPAAYLLIDEAERLNADNRARVQEALLRGARVVSTDPADLEPASGVRTFAVPPLSDMTGLELVRRMVPSLTPPLAAQVLEFAARRPGPLKQFLARLATTPVVSPGDVEALLGEQSDSAPQATAHAAQQPPVRLELIHTTLDRGRFLEAQGQLSTRDADHSLLAEIARARLHIGLGEDSKAAALLRLYTPDSAELETLEGRLWRLWLGRAEIGVGEVERARAVLEPLSNQTDALGIEARVYLGLAQRHSGQSSLSLEHFEAAAQAAAALGARRVEGLARLCAGLVLAEEQRFEEALASYELALGAAQDAGDANTLATTQSNLAVLMRRRGDLARAITHLESAIDAGQRAGRRRAVHVALCNLANTELYVGRLERAQQSIEALERDRENLGPRERAQLDGLRADLALLSGDTRGARAAYLRCAAAYEAAGLKEPAAEARLECLLLATGQDSTSTEELESSLEKARQQLNDNPTHRPLLKLAEAHLTDLLGQHQATRAHLDAALLAAEETQQREWIWRTLEQRAELSSRNGQPAMARRDREAALLVLEAIAAGLPPDLREVYWNDERRARLRAALRDVPSPLPRRLADSTLPSDPAPAQQRSRFFRLLEINAELLGEFDLNRLCARVIEYALELLDAERGFVILGTPDGGMTVHTARDAQGDKVRTDFSRSIARRAMATNQPVISHNAGSDANLKSYASVHELRVQGVACVPIHGRQRTAIGGLYLECRGVRSRMLEAELKMLEAFADQVGLAIETARLISENLQRTEELRAANTELESAQERLRELLGERTQKLKAARKRLRDAEETLYGHFGYQGLVGVSQSMRRVYSLIDRIKDADVPVLIGGESGTGKEVAARAIHRASNRSRLPFQGINCGAIPEHLLESELFGHVRGAFTGADRERKGLLREAAGGTVLLDEIGEMPHKMQAGLLRVLQEKRVRPVGGTIEEPIECRFLFATHRDLQDLVRTGKFREDLYYRIVVVRLDLPPLRERTEDIAALADHFFGLFAARHKRDRKSLSKSALQTLCAYAWPGNVRQLEHVLLNAWILSDGAEIGAEDLELPSEVGHAPPRSVAALPPPPVSERGQPPSSVGAPGTRSNHQEGERARIARALSETNWNRVKAAELLGIPRRTFYRRLRQYGLQ